MILKREASFPFLIIFLTLEKIRTNNTITNEKPQ
ncbi:hypothetical protein Murru_2106 [Allomuricauda ruestringensis DSM 13258]|uniref:Uncharacterized protein n=1 Tax=Allomuricauda ruestringensis (strain DSM 13258 / CIP 107369 / LMG 19739 / B1) TaxID=886377 RepID=G2PLQ8_ALLRU|nr:hypothetical protein Murru_2106 [Allomuricauda ruestringensis DSM 13258]